jgi:hypothetical protein
MKLTIAPIALRALRVKLDGVGIVNIPVKKIGLVRMVQIDDSRRV